MRYMTLVRASENQGPPPAALMEAMDKGAREQSRDGVLIQTGGLGSTATGVRVRISGKKLMVTDGPFTEAKEVIGGYAILEAASREEAVKSAKWFMQLHIDHWPGWEGEAEVREHYGAP